MSFAITIGSEEVVVELRRWDRLMNGRRQISFDASSITKVSVERRGQLEPLVSFRVFGIGTHSGRTHPNRRRVGAMTTRGSGGNQFWAVAAGDEQQNLLVLTLTGHQYGSAVLEVAEPKLALSRLKSETSKK